MKGPDTDTIASTEVRLKPYARAVTIACMALGSYLIARSWGGMPAVLWLPLALAFLGPTWSNLWFFRTTGATIGQVPLQVFSLAPAALAATLTSRPASLAWWACLALCVASCTVLALFCWWFWRIRSAYGAHPSVDVDAVLIVLGGLVRHGRPVPTVEERLDVAARLWKGSQARCIVLTGGPTLDGTTTEAQAMASWLMAERSIPRDALFLEDKAINTEQNLRRSAALIREVGLDGRQVCVVSSDYHLYRARELARRVGLQITAIASPTPWRSLPQQWCREVLVILAKL